MVNYEEKIQLFFSCLVKTKMNLYSIANKVKDKKIISLIDKINETQNKLFLLAMERNIFLDFELNSLESFADYSYRIMDLENMAEYREEIKKISIHILQHFGEIIRAHMQTNEFHIVYELSELANAVYLSAREIYL